jgi:hypothetical protein
MTTPDETATCPKVRDLFPSMPGTVLLQCTRPEGHLGRHRGNDVEWWGGDHGSKCPAPIGLRQATSPLTSTCAAGRNPGMRVCTQSPVDRAGGVSGRHVLDRSASDEGRSPSP